LKSEDNFYNIYTHDLARVAEGIPKCQVANPPFNAQEVIRQLLQAHGCGACLAVFPELGLSAYTCDDLFHQRSLLDACEASLADILEASKNISIMGVVGMPLRVDHRLFNCAVVVLRGKILGAVPKTYLPNYGEFYEARQFNSADEALSTEVTVLGQVVPFGADLLFSATDMPLFKAHIELCEDVWAPIPPSSYAALAGATILMNLSASNVTVGKSSYRHQLVGQQSARCLAAYIYSSAGVGESTTDMAWDGQALIYENGELLAESERFARDSMLITADVDLERVSRERMRQTSFGQSVRRHRNRLDEFREVKFEFNISTKPLLPLKRTVERFPYVPADYARQSERCLEVYNIQVQSLVQRLKSSGISKVVVGVSGGLDSTHALLVCARTMDQMGLPRGNILGYTMPGFATSPRTLAQARRLMEEVGCTSSEIDIRPSCEQMLKDIAHPYAKGIKLYDVTFENVQAGERTSHLFRLANMNAAIVVGTGDLSELALGWCTYGVGDHMSHYNVNASVPKTLIRHLVRWVSKSEFFGASCQQVLIDILGTEISPELVPCTENDGEVQSTQSVVGAYDLQDFNLYYTVRFGFAPSKVAFLALNAWSDRNKGAWPDGEEGLRTEYQLGTIKETLRTFVSRFFKGSQFKRTCVPNSPKVGSGGSLSPRGDWRAPSDSESDVWLKDIEVIPG
jgi:NAD+ synthase (glutamine-hydrolysing)